MKGGAKVIIEAHRHEGVFIARSKEDALVTLNSTPGKHLTDLPLCTGMKNVSVTFPPTISSTHFYFLLCSAYSWILNIMT